ncbi:MAG TPA: ABC-F family ATP-binding cassette domain-containing protein [Bacillota bacterium]|nr:ABC-F family ATP-binding cassette domain-containing protein [Bacillota bacterium]
MALLQVKGLTKYYGSDQIFEDLSFEIHPGEKMGLIGRNGCGKTTLINILTGTEDYDRGEIHWAQNYTFGYLPQILEFNENISVYQELRSIFSDLDRLQVQIDELQHQMNQAGIPENRLRELVDHHHELTEKFATAGGYQVEGRIQGVLKGLGFPKERWHDSIAVLSGGERTRLALARLLLKSYDLLFLDEPTNYLDIEAVEWLEEFLASYKGAVLLVSHDRYFLDKVVQGFLEMEFGRIKRYRGNYSEYRTQKEAEYQSMLRAYEKQEKEIGRLEKFVRESRATEKSKRKAHSIEKRLLHMERVEKPLKDDKALKLRFKNGPAGARIVLECDHLSKRYGDKVILHQAQLKVEAGEKIGLIGPNGVGKTTLLKMIMGYEAPDSGEIRLGYEIRPGYFSQLDNISAEGTPFSQIMAAADLSNTEARTILGRFLFSGDDVFKNVADLSGGERRRLGLIKLMLSEANFLILDEPTNHLDLASIEVVENALAETENTVLVVSHDRYFLKKVVDRYLALVNGQILPFADYEAYVAWKKSQAEIKEESSEKLKTQTQIHRENTKEIQRQLRRKQRELVDTEAEIEKVECRRDELYQLLNDPAIHNDYQQSAALAAEFAEVEKRLETLYQQWEILQEELAAMG